MPSKLKICKSKADVRELIAHCKTTGMCSHDFETTSLQYYNPNEYPLCMGVSFQPGSAWIIPLGHKDSPFQKNWRKILRLFAKQVIEDFNIVKIAWNFKFEYKWWLSIDIMPKGRLFDAMLAKYCLDEEPPHGLKEHVTQFYPEFAGYEDKIDKKVAWADKDADKLYEYCGLDTDLTLRSFIYMEPRLIKGGFYNLFRNLLMMAVRVFGESEYRGIRIDRPYLEEIMGIYKTKIADSDTTLRSNRRLLKYERKYKKHHLRNLIEKVELEIEEIEEDDNPNAATLIANRNKKIQNYLAGTFSNKDRYDGFNFNSPKQMGEFLYSSSFGLKLKPLKQTKSGGNSTDEESIEAIKTHDRSGFMDQLLIHRGLVKLDSTYISGIHPLLDYVDRVHANFKIHGTVTGRLSCGDPNLQNIPRDTTSSDIKKMFIPPPGYLLLEVDYSQAELRVVAELAQDKVMIDIFKRNYNIHVATACKVNDALERYDEIKAIIKKGDAMSGDELKDPKNKEILFWLKQKKRAKTINFGILYGQGAKKLSIELECTEAEAEQIIEDWFKAYPGVRRWIKRQQRFCLKNEYVTNMFGRKRRLYNASSPKPYEKFEALRQAINTPIQGTSSDFAVFSTVILREEITRGKLLPPDMQMCYEVHDSIGFYIRPADIHRVIPIVKKICDNPLTQRYFGFKLKYVEMKVSAEVGLNWGSLNEYNPKEDYTTWLIKKAA